MTSTLALRRLVRVLPALVALALAACVSGSSVAGPTGAPGGSVAPGVSVAPGGSPLSEAAAKYRLIGAVGRPFFCDPDAYPVARQDESALAAERLPAISTDAATYAAIAGHLRLDRRASLSPDEALAIYREWKLLHSIQLVSAQDGWSFDVAVETAGTPGSGERMKGTVAADGRVHVSSREPAGILSCPICLARGTRIATPSGEVPVEALQRGDRIWTFGLDGRRVVGMVVSVGHTPVPRSHRVVRLVLSDGRLLEASPGHPLLDGRAVGSLVAGDAVDGATVVVAELVPYSSGDTFDLLASGATGGYLADGIPLRSTIHP